MKITKVKKMSSGKYKVEFDNNKEMIIYEDVIVENELLGKEIDASLLLKIDKQNNFAEIYNKTIKYIETRLRSVKEIKEYLKSKNISASEQEVIIQKLKQVGLLDDLVFAKAYINDKLNLSNQGFVKMKNYLLQHDIDEETIDEIINNIDIDYDDRIKSIVKKQIIHNKGKSKFIMRNKIYNHLLALGYESNDILKNLDLNDVDDDNQLGKEYDKLYSKLSKKYQGKELSNQLKRKLYQRGFDYSKVDEYIATKNES